MIMSLYSYVAEIGGDMSVVYNSLHQSMVVLPDATIEAIRECKCDTLEPKLIEELSTLGVISQSHEEDKSKALYSIDQMRNSSSIGYLTILVTYACNLKCYYCMQNNITSNQHLSPENTTVLKEWISSWVLTNHIEQLNITFIGGEPLLNISSIDEIIGCLSLLEVSCKYSLVTNGSLITDDFTRAYICNTFDVVQFTIDGPKEVHDSIKISSNGGTYVQIMDAICFLAKHSSSEIHLRINYERGNENSVTHALDEIACLDIVRPILVYPSELFDTDGSCGIVCDSASTYYLDKLQLYSEIAQRGFRFPFPFPSPVCYMTSVYSYVITPELDLLKCYPLVGKREHVLGNILGGKLCVESYKPLWLSVPKYYTFCVDCMYFPMCQGCGGCSIMRILYDVEVANDVDCIYKAKFGAAISKMLPLYVSSMKGVK